MLSICWGFKTCKAEKIPRLSVLLKCSTRASESHSIAQRFYLLTKSWSIDFYHSCRLNVLVLSWPDDLERFNFSIEQGLQNLQRQRGSKDSTFQKAERQRGREAERQRDREVQLFKRASFAKLACLKPSSLQLLDQTLKHTLGRHSFDLSTFGRRRFHSPSIQILSP